MHARLLRHLAGETAQELQRMRDGEARAAYPGAPLLPPETVQQFGAPRSRAPAAVWPSRGLVRGRTGAAEVSAALGAAVGARRVGPLIHILRKWTKSSAT